jgi:hypothetical protein
MGDTIQINQEGERILADPDMVVPASIPANGKDR